MKFNRKLDNWHRLLFTQEFREYANIEKNQEFEIEFEEGSNKITLTMIKNTPELDLDENKDRLNNIIDRIREIPHNDIISKVEEETEDTITVKLEDTDKIYWDKGILKHGKKEIPTEPVTENTTIIEENPVEEEVYTEPKFKSTDVIEFVQVDKIPDEELSKVRFCPYCDLAVEPTSFIKINGKFICSDCIKELKEQLKEDIKARQDKKNK